ncbi:uncharacterized protein LY89DRAFT_783598 [Mollisia scopiformis]|uniref:Uncharacterized protein n=1 Tax=Mollisia scopiformis TaxID=149040 RepID=A0A194X5V5_MOLSC|nr:uncharacterized protein LY89DRAFT_783598 [Mollisia scopiformis]KUJ15459.1 hypothetical protein LY89DRAFT_783598 [Mollisia scopiformis]
MADRTSSRKTTLGLGHHHNHNSQARHDCRSSSTRKFLPPQSSPSQPYRPPLPPITLLQQPHLPVLDTPSTSYHQFPGVSNFPGPPGPGPGFSSFMALPPPLPIPVSVPAAYQTTTTTTTTTTTEIDVLMQSSSPDYATTNTEGDVSFLMSSHSDIELGFSSSKAFPLSPGSSSTTTGTLSFLTTAGGTPSVVTEDLSVSGTGSGIVTGGYVMVSHRRTYSDQSNRSSGEGGGLYSTPDEEWVEHQGEVWGAVGTGAAGQRQEFAVEVEMEGGDEEARSMPHDPKLVLYSLGTNEPRPVENPYQYQQVQSSGYQDAATYQDQNQYSYQTVNHQVFVQTSGPAKVSSDGPWSPVAPQVPVYDSGYVAFLPSPGPAGEQDSETSQSRASSATHSPQPGDSSVSKRRSKKAGGKGKEKDVSGWEHTVVSKGGLQFVSENVKEEVDVRSGIRKGKLDPETAEKARRIRRMKACWNCWIQKVPCSEEKTCERCTKLFSPVADQLCCRSGFKDYESTFFPDYLHAHFKKKKIEDLISEHTSGFSNTVLVVDVSTGGLFKAMTLTANVFKPKTRELLRHASLVSQPGQDSQLVERYSAPVGILGLSPPEMKKLCTEHIDEMIANPSYAAQATAGDDTKLPCEILEIVRKYCSKKDIPLVQNALKMHAIHYFMSTLITFSEESAEKVSRSIRNYDALLEPYLSSRLLNRQIKYVMHKLHRELTIEVLEGLERSLRARTKDSWGPSFCTILILCLCIEDLQIAADTMVVCDMLKKGNESQYTRDQSYQVCLALDEYPFSQCKRLFHDIYKSHKEANGGAREGGFNPLRSVHEKTSTGLDATTDAMVKSVYGVVEESYDEMVELSKRIATIEFGYTVKPKDIKTNNTGRLASDFLRSFFPDS